MVFIIILFFIFIILYSIIVSFPLYSLTSFFLLICTLSIVYNYIVLLCFYSLYITEHHCVNLNVLILSLEHVLPYKFFPFIYIIVKYIKDNF